MGAAQTSPDQAFSYTQGTSHLFNKLHPFVSNPMGGDVDTYNYRLCHGSENDPGARICLYDPTTSGEENWEWGEAKGEP